MSILLFGSAIISPNSFSLSEYELFRLEKNNEITVYGVITKIQLTKGWKSKIPMAKATFKDISNTTIPIVWMNQPYMAKMFSEGDQVKLTGKITETKSGKSFNAKK